MRKKPYLCGFNQEPSHKGEGAAIMDKFMEMLLHYVWQHRMFPLGPLTTTDGQELEIIDPGLHNHGAGPDFSGAKIRIGGQLWAGNVEIHLRATDWYRHHHDTDVAYDSVVLHVVGTKDCEVTTTNGRVLPSFVLPVPAAVEDNYRELLAEEAYPPCYRVIPQLSRLEVHSWMSALTIERLETKTQRIEHWLKETTGDWERAFFIILARAFGFGTNADAMERWAATIHPQHIGKHRDSLEQVEAFFLGMAGLVDTPPATSRAKRAEAADANDSSKDAGHSASPAQRAGGLEAEWRFLRSKFDLTPLPRSVWKMGRLRPQNSPQVRLAQLAELYHSRRLDFSRVREAKDIEAMRRLLTATGGGYTLSDASTDLLIINAIAPILFAYGRSHSDEALTERAFELLESVKAESNAITRSWAKAGITSQHAADSQALIELRTRYCDRKDCLRCRFGAAYLKKVQR